MPIGQRQLDSFQIVQDSRRDKNCTALAPDISSPVYLMKHVEWALRADEFLTISGEAVDESDAAVIDLSRVNRDTEVSGWSDNPDFNIIRAIKANLAGLHSDERTDSEKAVHQCWVLHLVGDAHQPLHSSALVSRTTFPDGDRGGNLIKVGSSNLQSLWDRLLPKEKTVGAVLMDAFSE